MSLTHYIELLLILQETLTGSHNRHSFLTCLRLQQIHYVLGIDKHVLGKVKYCLLIMPSYSFSYLITSLYDSVIIVYV